MMSTPLASIHGWQANATAAAARLPATCLCTSEAWESCEGYRGAVSFFTGELDGFRTTSMLCLKGSPFTLILKNVVDRPHLLTLAH